MMYEQAQNKEDEFCVVNYDEEKCIEAQNERVSAYFALDTAEFNLNNEKSYKEYFVSKYAFLKNALNDWYFKAYVDRGDSSIMHEFIVIKDSSKMVTPIIKTADTATNVEISTTATLPFDTTIQAEELVSGIEYERIMKILGLNNNLTFDLKLYSDSISKYITKLDDGEFEVKIPILEDFKDKDLMVYYVNEDGKVENYEVEIEDGYATFKTTHFSIYTLGYKEKSLSNVKVTFDANGGNFGDEVIYTVNDWNANLYDSLIEPTRDGYVFKGYYSKKTGGTKLEMILDEAGIDNNSVFYAQWEKDVKNPETFDGIGSSIVISIISLLGIISTILYLKKKEISLFK